MKPPSDRVAVAVEVVRIVRLHVDLTRGVSVCRGGVAKEWISARRQLLRPQGLIDRLQGRSYA